MASISDNSGMIDDRNLISRGIINSPFFDMSNFFMPQNFKDLARWALFYYMNDPTVHPAVNKLSQYPITGVVIDPSMDKATADIYEKCYSDMKIDRVLKKFGKEYFSLGNSFMVIYKKFNRFLKCTNKDCGHEHALAGMEQSSLSFIKADFSGMCPSCKKNTRFTIRDEYIIAPPNVIFLDLFDVTMDFNEATGEATYYYDIPKEIKQKLEKSKDEDFRRTIPKDYIEAFKAKKKMKFKKKIFHGKLDSVSGSKYGEWGIPLVQPALKTLFFKWSLRKTNLAIAQDRLDAKRYICPASTNGDGTTMAGGNGVLFRKAVEEQLRKFQYDKNYIGVFPENITYGRFDGEGKMFLTLEEEKQLDEEIISAMELPIEFIKGGLQWSGSSVSLRMVENFMLSYRTSLHELLSFINEGIEDVYGLDKHAKSVLEDFKMADDVQQQNSKIAMAQNKIIAESQIAKEMGYDYKEQIKMMISDEKEKKTLIKLYAENQAMLSAIAAKENAKTQMEASKMGVELALQNYDGGYKIRDIEVKPEALAQWRKDGYPMGELMGAIEANTRNQILGTKLQMDAAVQQQQLQQQMQPQQPGEQPQVDASGMPAPTPEEQQYQAMVQQVMQEYGVPQEQAEQMVQQYMQEQQQGGQQPQEGQMQDGQQEQIQPQAQPKVKKKKMTKDLDTDVIIKRFDRMSRLDDEGMIMNELNNMSKNLTAEEADELMFKFNMFMTIKSMREKKLSTSDIKGYIEDNGEKVGDFEEKAMKFMAINSAVRNIKFEGNSNNPFAWKQGTSGKAGGSAKPLPEQLPPRREDSPI